MKTRRTKIREHLRSARVASLTPEERREEIRAAEARCAERHGHPDETGVDPADTADTGTRDSAPGSPTS
jgi:hypothetical protein